MKKARQPRAENPRTWLPTGDDIDVAAALIRIGDWATALHVVTESGLGKAHERAASIAVRVALLRLVSMSRASMRTMAGRRQFRISPDLAGVAPDRDSVVTALRGQ